MNAEHFLEHHILILYNVDFCVNIVCGLSMLTVSEQPMYFSISSVSILDETIQFPVDV